MNPKTVFPVELNEKDALEIAYGRELNSCVLKLKTRISVLIECEKQIIPFVYMRLRNQLKENGVLMEYLDGRAMPGEQTTSSSGILRVMLAQIQHHVRNTSDTRVLVLPHLDLLCASSSSDVALSMEARELIPLLYENPRVVFLGFKDPNFSLSPVIENLFIWKPKLLGIERRVLPNLILEREARKFPATYNFYKLYQYLSGLNPVHIRQVLSRLDGIDYPQEDTQILKQIREMTMDSSVELPQVDLNRDIGGYQLIKDKIEKEILSFLRLREECTSEQEIKELDSLIPRGMIFHGPPGTGKTYFAKAIASALNATIQIISGPELKSMWVGQSEQNIRKVFFKARQCAPSIIVFDELDSFASARNQEGGSTVQHGMVNQLLTEMDGFRKEELVFVVGTTNFVSSLDPALLRPGRFEMKIEIPVPEENDRLEILELYRQKMNLPLRAEQIAWLARKSGDINDPITAQAFSGDHLNACMRYLKRQQIREQKVEFTPNDLHQALRGGEIGHRLSAEDIRVVATHEAGHAIVAMSLKDAEPVERISVDSDFAEALGYVKQSRSSRYVVTRKQLFAELVILMGGREAEILCFQDLSAGSENDILRANRLVNLMVGRYGMSEIFGVRVFDEDSFSAETLARRDKAIEEILLKARASARSILDKKPEALQLLTETLVQKKVLEKEEIELLLPKEGWA